MTHADAFAFRDLLADTAALRLARAGLWSALLPADEAAPYDRLARGYDLLVGNTLYNRLVWGAQAAGYGRRAAAALAAAGDGRVLDCGCGSLVFTGRAYSAARPDRLLLLDRSLGMLERARARLPAATFLQGDALRLPFVDGAFDAVFGWGMLHVFGTRSAYLGELRRVLRPGGRVFLSTLVLAGRAPGDRMLALLHARGEAAAPESAEAVMAEFAARFGDAWAEADGNMLFLEGIA